MAILRYPEILFLVSCILFLCHRVWSIRRGQRKCSIAPTNWPLVGMLPGVFLNTRRLHDYMTEVLEKCGGTFEFKGPSFCNVDMLITSDPANIHYILSKNFTNFSKGPDFNIIFEVLGDGIFNAIDKSWEIQRKISLQLFHNKNFENFVVKTIWRKMETGLIPVLDHFSETQIEAVDLQDVFQRLTFDSTSILVLGHDPATISVELPHNPFTDVFSDAGEAALYRHILPKSLWKLQKWLHIGKERKLTNAVKLGYQYLAKCFSLKRENLNKINPNKEVAAGEREEGCDLLTSFFKLAQEIIDVASLDTSAERLMRDISLNFMVAGRDSVSAALTWFFWLISKNPEDETKIREEIITNMRKKEDGSWNFSNLEDIKKLNYLRGALSEAMRLFPPVALQHKAPVQADILPSGHRLSPNTRTVLSFYSMGRMETIWGKDCLEFKPGRWITEKGGFKHEPSFKFTAFNAGPRTCVGREISFLQMQIVAATIIHKYQIHVVEGQNVSPKDAIIIHIKHGLKVLITKRCV